MEQNATHLLYLFGVITGTLALPIVFGLVAVLREGPREPQAETASQPSVEGLETGA
ncbi:MAG: hypothetical protein ACE5FG_07675 [Myxococcota bacterium]